jgi:hypothetical protein
MTIQAYPLQWPDGWPRTSPADRKRAAFGKRGQHESYSWQTKKRLSVSDGRTRINETFSRMRVDDMVISTNLALRLDGQPRSDQREPQDCGVAVYWMDKGERRCMAIDRYDTVADNLAAIAGTLEALRAVERYGGAKILDRAFTGFQALPPGRSNWRDVLGFDEDERPTKDQIEYRYRLLRSASHPDKGGTVNDFRAVENAHADALREIGA